MARKEKENIVDALFDISAMLPWWVSVVIAVGSYFLFRSFATAEVAPPQGAGQFAPAIQQTIVKALATFAQYVVPMIFLAGAAASAIAQARRNKESPGTAKLASGISSRKPAHTGTDDQNVQPSQHEQDLYPIWRSDPTDAVAPLALDISQWSQKLLGALEWRRFEIVCAGLFERLGFATRMATPGADGGVDIDLFRPPGEEAVAIVQCKAWTSSSKVGVRLVRELHGVMASKRIADGILMTTTVFSEEAKEYAKHNHIDLMDGRAVLEAILALTEEQQASLLQLATEGDYTTPTCPSCAIKMTKRSAKADGKQFWGCVNYPRCRSIINIAKT